MGDTLVDMENTNPLWGVCVCIGVYLCAWICTSVPWAEYRMYVYVHVQGCVFTSLWRHASSLRGAHTYKGVHMWLCKRTCVHA